MSSTKERLVVGICTAIPLTSARASATIPKSIRWASMTSASATGVSRWPCGNGPARPVARQAAAAVAVRRGTEWGEGRQCGHVISWKNGMLGIKELCRKQRLGCLNAFSTPGRPVLHATPVFIDPFFQHSNHPWDATDQGCRFGLECRCGSP